MALSDRLMVRLNIADTGNEVDKQVFTDAQIDAFLSRNGSDVDLASSNACAALAANATLLAKMERIGDYQIDQRSMADKYIKLAAVFAGRIDEVAAVDVAEINTGPFAERQILANAQERAN